MPNRWIKGAAAVILACCLAQGGLITAMAATRPIKSVSMRVNSKLEAGSIPARHRHRDRNTRKKAR